MREHKKISCSNPGTDGISLREAITAANSDATYDTINFAVNGEINLSSLGQLTIATSLRINGPGANLLTIRAYDPSAAVGDGRRVFNVDGGVNVLNFVGINDVTITGGDLGLNQVGGGVFNREVLEITNSTIINNRTLHVGGGIGSNSDGGQLSIENCTITGNSASNQASLNGGGGVYAGSSSHGPGRLVIITSNISNNSAGMGGGVSASINTVIDGCTITGNTAVNDGGGANAISYQPLTITSSMISGNCAGRGGGGVSGQYVNINNSSVSDNSVTSNLGTGGGVSGRGSITSSTISGNRSAGIGGGAAGGFELINSTISGNTAAGAGGGIHVPAERWIAIRHSTISGNTAPAGLGSGIASPSGIVGHEVQVQSSIIAGNANSDVDRTDGAQAVFKSLGYNLVGTGNSIGAFSTAIGDKIGLDPMLSVLSNNGGSTQTRSLLPGSPAIDAGSPSAVTGVGTVPSYDQRGAPNNRLLGARIDIGAFESTPGVPSLLGDYNQNGIVDAADYVVWRQTLGSATDLRANGDTSGASAGIIDQADYHMWRANFSNKLEPPTQFGDYNTNDSVDAADYVLWRKSLGSTTDLRANGDNTGASAGVIDQADYAVWRNHFGAAIGAGTGEGESSEQGAGSLGASVGASGGGVELAMGSGEGVISSGELGVASGEGGAAIKDASRLGSVNGDSPSPQPSPRGRWGKGMATQMSGRIEATVVGESELLMLLGMVDWHRRLLSEDDVSTIFADDAERLPADEVVAIDVVFAGVGQTFADGWGFGG